MLMVETVPTYATNLNVRGRHKSQQHTAEIPIQRAMHMAWLLQVLKAIK